MKRIIPILIAILICFSVGCTASYFQSESILNWYPALEKPSCTPPDIAFPIAWSFIYLCMGISIGLIWHIWTIRRQMIIRLFGFQLLFNFTWSIFFFYFRSPLLGFANILVLDVLVIYYMIESYPVRKSAYRFPGCEWRWRWSLQRKCRPPDRGRRIIPVNRVARFG